MALELSGIGIVLFTMMVALFYMDKKFSDEDNWSFYLSYACRYVALLIPLFGIRMLANTGDYPANIIGLLEAIFIIYLSVYMVLFLFHFVYILHLFFIWIVEWKKPPHKKRVITNF